MLRVIKEEDTDYPINDPLGVFYFDMWDAYYNKNISPNDYRNIKSNDMEKIKIINNNIHRRMKTIKEEEERKQEIENLKGQMLRGGKW